VDFLKNTWVFFWVVFLQQTLRETKIWWNGVAVNAFDFLKIGQMLYKMKQSVAALL